MFSPERQWDDTLEHEYAVTTRLGIDMRRHKRVPGLAFDTGPCLRFAGRKSDWTALYDPARKACHGLGEFITEQANALAQYTDWLRGGDRETVDEIGAVPGTPV